uniref:m7GpppN-mRNA hydrolase NUDT17 n=1 Tax=Caligus clemensi TaxID=344056 RepID=C1C244_CALCM|nr:nucleoside diphosphate-linked moiety X motif 17, mitochondrial precursor [Caligus clemensi]
MTSRVSTFVRGSQSPIDFHACLITLLGSNTDSVHVNIELENQRLLIERKPEGVVLKHPPSCPLLHCPPENIVPSDRNVDVGVCALLETSDDYVLLTRRSKTLRTFPGSWVPPGGTADLEDASLLDTCLRELSEETGLKDLDLQASRLICCWESVYPYLISLGPPKRHHIVLYYLLKSKKSKVEFEKELCVQRAEVDAVTWIHSSLAIEVTDSGIISDKNSSMTIHFPKDDASSKPTEAKKMSSDEFFSMSSSSPDSERITTGTIFALAQWAQSKLHS